MRTGLAALIVIVMWTGMAQAQECGLKQYESIPMEVQADRLLLPVSLGGAPRQMMFRLEDAASALTTATVEKMGLRRTLMPPYIVINRDGAKVRYTVHVSEVQFGHQVIRSMEFLEVPTERYADDVAGAIGTRLFQNKDFELDMAGGKFNLFSSDHCPGKTVYWTKTGFAQLPIKPSEELGFIRVPMTLDGQPVTVALSTTAHSLMGMNAMRRIFNIDENSPGMSPTGQDRHGHKLYRYAFKALAADSLTILNPDILIYGEAPRPGCSEQPRVVFPKQPVHSTEQEHFVFCYGGEDAVLGLSVLKKLHLYVSGREKLLYLTGAEAK